MKELAFEGMIYIDMLEGETQEQAEKRLYETLEEVGVCVGEYNVEAREV